MARLRGIVTEVWQLCVLELFSLLDQQFQCEVKGNVRTDVFVALWAWVDIWVSFPFRELDFNLGRHAG
jgi:hypothetical protein